METTSNYYCKTLDLVNSLEIKIIKLHQAGELKLEACEEIKPILTEIKGLLKDGLSLELQGE